MIQKRISEFDLSGENTADVDNDGPHIALANAEEVKQEPESGANYLTGSKIEGELTESRDNSVCAVCHRHIALNASGLVRINCQKLTGVLDHGKLRYLFPPFKTYLPYLLHPTLL